MNEDTMLQVITAIMLKTGTKEIVIDERTMLETITNYTIRAERNRENNCLTISLKKKDLARA